MAERTEPKVLVVIDNGLSESKILWNTSGEPVRFMRLSPEIIEVSSRNILDSGLKSGRPEDNALIELADGSLFAVGKQARDLRGKSPVEETKYQMSVFKIIAAIGAIATHLGVKRLKATISTLLPYSEYQDRKQFIELLKKHLKEFSFQSQQMECIAETVIVKPEGAGIAINYMNAAPEFDDQNTLIVMVGHRDASLLAFEQGAPNTGLGDQLGDQLGFLEFQKQVIARAALNITAKNLSRLPEYLFKAKEAPEYAEEIARMVVTGREVKKKTEQLEGAIYDSQLWYVDTLTHWIKTTLGPFLREIDHVVISGGTAFYLKEELTEFFESLPRLKNKNAITWGSSKTEIERLIGETLAPELAVRLADAYGLYMDTVEEFPELVPGKSDILDVLSSVSTSPDALTAAPANTNGASATKRRSGKQVELPEVSSTKAKG